MPDMKLIAAITGILALAMVGCGIYTATLGAFFTTLIIFVCAATTIAQTVVVGVLSRRRTA